MSRYDTFGGEGEYQSGSDNKVLRNLPAITDPREMNVAETDLLEDLYILVFDNFPKELTLKMLRQWHPFREGNGRISRLLLDVMAVKAGAQPLDYSLWDEHKAFYFTAIQAGLDGDFQHVERLIRDVLEGQQ
jgi:cell filamentation protein